jgi:hypothetical protein
LATDLTDVPQPAGIEMVLVDPIVRDAGGPSTRSNRFSFRVAQAL